VLYDSERDWYGPAENGYGGEMITRTLDIPNCAENYLNGRMTGGGTIQSLQGLSARHGFELRCDPAASPQRLEINWGKGNKFHLDNVETMLCSDTNQLVEGFDKLAGTGFGKYNGKSGYNAQWSFVDSGEPGKADAASIKIFDGEESLVIAFEGLLHNGNHKTHQ
jgi:hypothetical protein